MTLREWIRSPRSTSIERAPHWPIRSWRRAGRHRVFLRGIPAPRSVANRSRHQLQRRAHGELLASGLSPAQGFRLCQTKSRTCRPSSSRQKTFSRSWMPSGCVGRPWSGGWARVLQWLWWRPRSRTGWMPWSLSVPWPKDQRRPATYMAGPKTMDANSLAATVTPRHTGAGRLAGSSPLDAQHWVQPSPDGDAGAIFGNARRNSVPCGVATSVRLSGHHARGPCTDTSDLRPRDRCSPSCREARRRVDSD